MAALGNKTCQVCSADQATHFCDCQDPPTLFCFDCSSRHSGKNRHIIHHTIPIIALDRSKDYKRKYKALMKAAAVLRKNVEQIDQCSREIEDLMKRCANYLTEYGSWWVQYMHTEKEGLSAAIEAAVLETTDCLNQGTELQSPLALLLWTSLPQDMQVISYSITAPDLQTILQTCISYQNSLQAICEDSKPTKKAKQDSDASISSSLLAANSPPQDISLVLPRAEEHKSAVKDTCAVQPDDGTATELVHVASAFLHFFNFQSSAWGPQVRLSTAIQVDRYSRWVMLEERVFCCGGMGIAAAYMLTRDGRVEQKAHMSVGRGRHGLQTAYNAAYAFGGIEGIRPIKTCEKWEIATNKWRKLPSMKVERYYFNPCLWEGKMYLCGCPSASMEVFVPQTDTFLPHLIPLSEDSACCVYVHNHLLVVHSAAYILKFAVDGQLTQHSQVTSPEISKVQNSQPVVDEAKGVFYVINEGKCVLFNMETGVQGRTVELG